MKRIVILSVLAFVGMLFALFQGDLGLSAHVSREHRSYGDYDLDDDGLIEIFTLDALDALRFDLNGDGEVDVGADADTYALAFKDAVSGMGCPDGSGCIGYELVSSLNFSNGSSYASGVVNMAWIEGDGWMPIGDDRIPYSGVLEGNGHTISDLFIDRFDLNFVGLFGEVSNVVNGLGLSYVRVTGASSTGSLAGWNSGTISESYSHGVVSCTRDCGGLVGTNGENGVVSKSESAVDITGISVVGGLAGVNYWVISESFSTGRTSAVTRVAGGIAGVNFHTVIDSYGTGVTRANDVAGGIAAVNQGEIIGSYSAGIVFVVGDGAGGLAGVNYNMISSSYSSARVSGEHRIGGLLGVNHVAGVVRGSYATGEVAGSVGIGGLVGWNTGVVDESYATGIVWSSEDDAGGLVGRNRGEVLASYATGDVSGYDSVGGLVGYNTGHIVSTYSSGAVSGDFATGGIAGWNRGDISRSYSLSAVSGMHNFGGVVGENTGTIGNIYWDVAVSGEMIGVGYGGSSGSSGFSSEELQSPVGYEGIYARWNLDGDVWDFGASDEYPVLKVDFDGDGSASWEEFGDQARAVSVAPLSVLDETYRYLGRLAKAFVEHQDVNERDDQVDVVCDDVVEYASGLDFDLLDKESERNIEMIMLVCNARS